MIMPSCLQEYEGTMYLYFDEDLNDFVGEFIEQNKNEFWNVVIYPKYRGKRLVEKMFSEFYEQQNKDFYILVVHVENKSARTAYERMGFKYVKNTIGGNFTRKDGYLQMRINFKKEK